MPLQSVRHRRFFLPAEFFIRQFHHFYMGGWQPEWDRMRNNKLKIIKPRFGVWRSASRKRRREEVTLCRLRIGHTLATHGYLCGGDSALCNRCGSFLTMKRVLISFPDLENERSTCFGLLSAEPNTRGLLCDDSGFITASSLFVFISTTDFLVIYSRRSCN